ncbi:MAG: hypothetical protein ACFFBP_03055 [Promethearchaeota archaeon]
MEIDEANKGSLESLEKVKKPSNLIIVRAIIKCNICGINRKFRNQFFRKDLELLVVALKVFDWMTCSRCGELFQLDLEFKI